MEKRPDENNNARRSIANAYIKLLRTKHPDDIRITEITADAKVSRMAFYRNFESKLDIVKHYLEAVIWRDIEAAYENESVVFWEVKYGILFFSAVKKHKDVILLLHDRGYSNLILQAFNETNEVVAGDMPVSSIDRYRIYFAAGASYNGMMKWLRDGCKESIEDMTRIIAEFMGIL